MDNREKILECALDLFYAKGYDAVGVQEIAGNAGVTKPTLYYYFGSKKGLLETLLQSRYQTFKRAIEEASWYEDDVPDLLYRVASAYMGYAMQNPKTYKLMMALFYSARENEAYQVVAPMVREFYHCIVRVFDQAANRLGNMNGRQEQFAIGFIGVLNHALLFQEERGAGSGRVSEEAKWSLVNQFMYGIFS